MDPSIIDNPALAPVTLHDGTVVDLHAMRPEDAADLLRFHHGLSPETTHLRFFTVHPELSKNELERFTHVDHHDREALVATVRDEIVAVARFDRLDDPDMAEVAFVVTDRWQGDGLGSALLDRLVQRAREEGMTTLVAETLPDNRRMVKVFKHAGLPMQTEFDSGVVRVQLDLSAATPPPGIDADEGRDGRQRGEGPGERGKDGEAERLSPGFGAEEQVGPEQRQEELAPH